MSVQQAAAELSITACTLYRWLNDGFVRGEQIPRRPLADPAHRFHPGSGRGRRLGRLGSHAGRHRRPWVSSCRPRCNVSSAASCAVHIPAGRMKGLRIQLLDPKTACSDHPRQ